MTQASGLRAGLNGVRVHFATYPGTFTVPLMRTQFW